jgi:sorting and assembly machinery component 37
MMTKKRIAQRKFPAISIHIVLFWLLNFRLRWTSYVFTHATETIDLYLFVTSHNYSSTTRPAYTEFLPTFLNYIVPPAHCRTAESRTQGLDIVRVLETAVDDTDNSTIARTRSDGADPTAGFPEKFGFGVRREGLSAAQKRIRLETMMARWIAPLEELLGRKKFLLSDDRLSSLDALALGYFSLILDVDVPDRWASRILEERFPKLVKWVRREAPSSFL